MKKTLITLATAAAAVVAPGIAQAELSANMALTSNYKFRGIDQSDNKPAIQGGFDFESGGFYLGNWNSSIGFTGAGIEMDVYGGYAGEVAGVGYDVGILYYGYPGESSLATTELYGGVTFGPVTVKYSHTVSSKWFGGERGRGNGYLQAGTDFELGGGLTLNAHVGYSRFTSKFKNLFDVPNYVDYLVGVTYDVGNGFEVAAAAVGATKRSFWGDDGKARLILTLSKSL